MIGRVGAPAAVISIAADSCVAFFDAGGGISAANVIFVSP